MNANDEHRLRLWLAARDPGEAPARLRAAAARVPYDTAPPRLPALDALITHVFGPARWIRPVLVVLVVLALIAAAVGAALMQPWRPFPPRGWIAYTAPISAQGSTGITLVSTDGTMRRQVSPTQANLFDHSPRWSHDGRTLLFARTTQLDPLSSCGGVGSVVLYDLATGTERTVATGLRPMNVIDWSPSGDRAAYVYPPSGCGAEVELGVVDLATGHATTTTVLPQQSEADPAGGIRWHVRWTTGGATAVPGATVTTANGRDFTTTVDVPSHTGSLVATSAWTTPAQVPHLSLVDGGTTTIELGQGRAPAWSPDDTQLAFVQPGTSAGPNQVELLRDRLTVLTLRTGATRFVADVLMPDGVSLPELPILSWIGDGEAVFWIDGVGAHVVDVVTGRVADLPAIPEGCTELAWQPTR